jgi:hypothetical protein
MGQMEIQQELQEYYLRYLPYRGQPGTADPCWAAGSTNHPYPCVTGNRTLLVNQLAAIVVNGGTAARQILVATGLALMGVLDPTERVARAWASLIAGHRHLVFDAVGGAETARRLGLMAVRATEPATARAALETLTFGTTSRASRDTTIAVRKAADAVAASVWDKPWSAAERQAIKAMADGVAATAFHAQQSDPGTPIPGTPPEPTRPPPKEPDDDTVTPPAPPRPFDWAVTVGAATATAVVVFGVRWYQNRNRRRGSARG